MPVERNGFLLACVESGDEGGLHLLWYGQRAWCLSLCFPGPTFRIGWEIHDFLQVEFATSSNAFLRQINSGFYRTGNSKKNSQTITLQIKYNRFILSSIWSITVELSALCPQGMRLSVPKKLKTTGMMWCKMWANHTYRTKVCFQNRKPPCPLRQLSTKNSRSNGKWCIFPGYSLTLGSEEKEVTKSPSLPESSLLLWKWERMQFCQMKTCNCLLILHPNEVKRSRHPSAIWVQCMLRFSGFHLQKKETPFGNLVRLDFSHDTV